jgi:hypothetical protein
MYVDTVDAACEATIRTYVYNFADAMERVVRRKQPT